MKRILTTVLAACLLAGCLEQPAGVTSANGFAGTTQPDNSAPTISGSPPWAILYAEIYDFKPIAVDLDGDKLTFSIENKPAWASFDKTNGALWGQPSLASIGVYDKIVISVSDGTIKDSLPEFTITVSEGALGSVTLSWAAPTENADGTALLDLAGFNIYIGKESGAYTRKIQIRNPGLTTYVVQNLIPDTYYFAATAFNSSAIESTFSAQASRVVN